MAQSQSLTQRLKERNRQTLAKLPPNSGSAADKPLELRLAQSKARLRHAASDLEGRLRVVTWAATAGLAFLRWRSKGSKPKPKRRMRL